MRAAGLLHNSSLESGKQNVHIYSSCTRLHMYVCTYIKPPRSYIHMYISYVTRTFLIPHLKGNKNLIKENKPSSKNILAMLCRKLQIPTPPRRSVSQNSTRSGFFGRLLFLIAQSRKSMLKRGYSLPFATSSVEETLGPIFSPFFLLLFLSKILHFFPLP